MLVLSGSIGTSIDCAALVPEPIDVVPIRSAQAIHTAGQGAGEHRGRREEDPGACARHCEVWQVTRRLIKNRRSSAKAYLLY